jgi:hypothetical protein
MEYGIDMVKVTFSAGRLSEVERVRMLETFDKVMTGAPTQSSAGVDRELRDVRAARRAGGRRHLQ